MPKPSRSPAKQPKVVVAIPCYNTGRFIKDVVTAARKHASQVVAIDDGSSDNTAAVAREAGATVVSHARNMGYGNAIKSCLEAGKTNGADVLVTLDGDGQHNPGEIPRLISPVLRGGADLVIGSRFLNDEAKVPGYRQFGIKVITFLFNFGSRTRVTDAQSGFRAYSRRALDAISAGEAGMSISIETLVSARAAGLNIAEVPISCHYHERSSTMNPVVHGVRVALSVIRLRLNAAGKRRKGNS